MTAALDDMLSGRGALVMLAGEAGIGKTRLAHEFTSLAIAQDAVVLWGRCHERRGAPPYWPWLQTIRTYLETAEADQLRHDMGPGAADIAEIIPELAVRLEGLEKPPTLDQEQARFRLFFSITNFLKTVSRRQPLVLVLDDLHWADESSLLLLEFIAPEISANSLMVVGTFRDDEVTGGHQLSQTLGSLVREENYQRIQLTGLSREEVGELVEARSGVAAVDAAVDTLHQRTEGNPLFVGEVVSSVSREEMARDQTWIAGIPEAVRDAILRRVNRLSGTCNEMLRTASVIGRDFDLPLLRTLSPEIAESEFLDCLDEALGTRIIEPISDRPGGYRFGHALIQQAVYEEIPPMRRAQAHGAVGETLERLHENDLDENAAELAHHFAEAEAVLGSDKVIRYSLVAGERALATYAHEEALGHFQQGLTARSGRATDNDGAKLWSGLGRCQVATLPLSQLPEAVASLRKAFDYYVEEGNVDQAVAIAEHPFPASAGRDYGVLQIIERALTLVPPASKQAGRLLARLGWLRGIEKADYEGSREALAQALDIAQREGDNALAVRTLVSAAEVEAFFFHYPEANSKSTEAIALLTEVDDPQWETIAHFWAGNSSFFLFGYSSAAERHISQSIAAAERLRHHFYLGRSLNQMSWMMYRKGEWQSARDFNDRGLAASPRETRLLHTRLILEYEVGNFSEGEAYLDRLLEVMRLTPPGPAYEYAFPAMSIPMAARISGDLSWLAQGEEAAHHVFSSTPATPMVAAMTNTGLALLALHRGDANAAEALYSAKQPPAAFGGLGPQINRTIGLLARTAGNVGEALGHFDDARAFCQMAGFRPELAWTCYDYAETLLGRNGEGDQAKAVDLLDESLTISSDLGMRPLMERVAALQEQAVSTPSKAPAYPDRLTQREVEVLRLIAVGRSSREVADDLVLSVRTVERHITNIYSKINARGRADATAYAMGHNLLDQM